jgi:acetylornithine deacetylase
MISAKAEKYGLEVSSWILEPFAISPKTEIVQVALKATGLQKPATVSFCTDAPVFKDYLQLVILGPGDISQAHTVGEWIAMNQLFESVTVYKRMIEMLCMV